MQSPRQELSASAKAPFANLRLEVQNLTPDTAVEVTVPIRQQWHVYATDVFWLNGPSNGARSYFLLNPATDNIQLHAAHRGFRRFSAIWEHHRLKKLTGTFGGATFRSVDSLSTNLLCQPGDIIHFSNTALGTGILIRLVAVFYKAYILS